MSLSVPNVSICRQTTAFKGNFTRNTKNIKISSEKIQSAMSAAGWALPIILCICGITSGICDSIKRASKYHTQEYAIPKQATNNPDTMIYKDAVYINK